MGKEYRTKYRRISMEKYLKNYDRPRWDSLVISPEFWKYNGLDGLIFQTKDLEREYLTYRVEASGRLVMEDFAYELVKTNDPNHMLSKRLEKINLGDEPTTITDYITVYGLKNEKVYFIRLHIIDGFVKSIKVSNIKKVKSDE